jgi:hypothetical protein
VSILVRELMVSAVKVCKQIVCGPKERWVGVGHQVSLCRINVGDKP